jgi:hypothetical protein
VDRPLNPNLARIAAAYDDVMASYRAGQITPQEARRRVLALVARDDNGLEWSINPDTGRWQYRSQFGEYVTAEPPAFGVAGFTPADLGAGNRNDDRITLIEVDQSALSSPGSLRGSTMFGAAPAPRHRRRSLVLLAAGAMLLVGLVTLRVLGLP